MLESIAEDLADRAMRKGKATLHEVAGRAVLIAIGVAAVVMAIGWGIYAGFLTMAKTMDPVEAAAIIGGVLLVIGALLIAVAVKGRNVVPAPAPARPGPEVEALNTVRFLRGLISGDKAQRNSNLTMLAVALAMGVLDGRQVQVKARVK